MLDLLGISIFSPLVEAAQVHIRLDPVSEASARF